MTRGNNAHNRKLWASELPLWLQYPMKPPDGSSFYGVSTAISKTNMIIGAPGTCGFVKNFPNCSISGIGNGTAYIYNFDAVNDRWLLQSSIIPPRGAIGFGWSVQISDKYALISARRTGAFGPDNGYDHAYGSAYMYKYNLVNTGWELIQSFSENNIYNFGVSTAMLSDGSLLAISAPSLQSNTGKVFIYRQASTQIPLKWTLQQVVKSPFNSGGTDFGMGINFDISNSNKLIIGSPNERTVHIFNYNTTSKIWIVEKTLASTGNQLVGSSLDLFGTNVALNGDSMFISGPGQDSLYIFNRKSHLSSFWLLTQTLSKPSDVTRYASSFQLIDSHTLIVASSLQQQSFQSNNVGIYLYKSNKTSNKFYQDTFLPCAVSESQGQLPVSMVLSPNPQIIVGGSYGKSGNT